jgi:hypothetical protein
MKLNSEILDSVFNATKCAFCDTVFYTKSHSARYCSTSCKKQFFKEKKKNQRFYDVDPNRGKTFPRGTVTSWEIPEDKLVFSGDSETLYHKLSDFISPKQFTEEKKYILKLRPFSAIGEWCESATQIFTEENFMEVFRVLPDEYKFYVWPWGEDNKKPYPLSE